jgi:hypothetical protein
MTSLKEQKSYLYEQDFQLWIEHTVSQLKNRNFENLDLENLIEEVEALGRSERKEFLNRLIVLLEHLIKRTYVKLPENYYGWELTIREQRRRLRIALEDTPSLKTIWETSFHRAWREVYLDLSEQYPDWNIPESWPYSSTLESVLYHKFWLDINS